MRAASKTKSAAVRERLQHPIVDGDGHFVETLPVLHEYFREIAGPKLFEKYLATLPTGHQNFDGGPNRVGGPQGWYGLTREQRRDLRVTRGPFWPMPTGNTLDRATVMFPDLFRARMDELGIDFAILYATVAIGFLRNPDPEIRVAGCRALNTMSADSYGPHADRMTPVAAIPMHSPGEALEELDYAIGKLGLKSVVLGSCIRRPIAEVARKAPEVASFATWMDPIGISSAYDYDPVWKKCMELRVAVTTHTNLCGWGARTSPDNFVYNHIGHFGQAGEAFCKALVIGGVVQRFPHLKFAFLEGGVGWACSLYNDLIEHWEVRNMKAMREKLDPAKLDKAELAELFERWGGQLREKKRDAFAPAASSDSGETVGSPLASNPASEDPAELVDWSAVRIDDPREFAKFFQNFFFGCEAEDRMTAVAFDSRLNHYGVKIQALFSSDVGHFDVYDITAVVADAYELVEDGLITDKDFRDFTFTNPVRLHGSMNPDFFKGTVVETAAAEVLNA